MGKIKFLALITIDGCVSNLKGIQEWGMKRDLYGVKEIYDNAEVILNADMTVSEITSIHNATKNCLYEAKPGDEEFIGKLFRHGLVDEIYIYMFSYLIGNGLPLFSQKVKISSIWKLKEVKKYNEEIVSLCYVKD